MTQYFVFEFCHKMSAGGHFVWPKITFDHISRHFRSIRNFHFSDFFSTKWPPADILDDRKSLSLAFLAISDKYATFNCLKFVPRSGRRGHFGWPKITFNRISRHFRSIRNFNFSYFFSQNVRRRPFWMTENHFLSHFLPFQINTQLFLLEILSPNVRRRPFWMTENHVWSYFSPFQINTLLFFFGNFVTKYPPAAILDDRKSLLIAFLAISDQCTTFFYNFCQNR